MGLPTPSDRQLPLWKEGNLILSGGKPQTAISRRGLFLFLKPPFVLACFRFQLTQCGHLYVTA